MWNIFKSKSQPVSTNENSITFISDGDKSWVSVDIESMDDKSLKEFAELLFYINIGKYQKTIVDILVSLCEQKPELSEKFETILKHWLVLDNNYEKGVEKKKINDPLIYPRDTFLGTEK